MKTRTTIFDTRISVIADILNAAVLSDEEHPIPERYINRFCDRVVEWIWRCASNAIVSMALYGDADGFIFNIGGYIDTMYDIDEATWDIPQYGAYRLGVSQWQANSRGNLRYFLESGKKVNAL